MLTRLQRRLVLGSILLVIVVFGVLGMSVFYAFQERERTDLRKRLESEAQLAAAALEPDSAAAPTHVTPERIADLSARADARIMLIDQDARVVADSTAPNGAPPMTMLNRRDVADALAGRMSWTEEWDDVTGQRVVAASAPLRRPDGATAAVRMSAPLRSNSAVARETAVALSGAFLLALVGAMAAASMVSRSVSDPVRDLTRAAKRVARGDLTAQVPVDRWGEFAPLSDAFNDMANHLRTMIRRVEDERSNLSAILEHLADGILILDWDGKVLLINNAAVELLGVGRERALGRSHAEVLRDYELAELIQEAREQTGDGGQTPGRFIELGRPRRSIQAFAYAVPSTSPPVVVVILRDITELRRTELVRRDFVANVSHDLRTPISSLKALVETLLDGALEDDAVARDFLSRMEIEVDNLARLVAELLELSRAESGQITLEPYPADIALVIRRVASRLEPQAAQKHLELDLDIAAELPLAQFDPDRIEQVLVNLVHNAVKFTPDHGRVTVGALAEGRWIKVFVRDTGPGIEPGDVDRVFERFYKADRSRSATGSGLGLAIAKHLVQLHGGRIWAESTYGYGATFMFTLRMAEEGADVPSALATGPSEV